MSTNSTSTGISRQASAKAMLGASAACLLLAIVWCVWRVRPVSAAILLSTLIVAVAISALIAGNTSSLNALSRRIAQRTRILRVQLRSAPEDEKTRINTQLKYLDDASAELPDFKLTDSKKRWSTLGLAMSLLAFVPIGLWVGHFKQDAAVTIVAGLVVALVWWFAGTVLRPLASESQLKVRPNPT